MKRIDLHIKVEVSIADDDDPSKIAEEICRMVRKMYSVRKAELSNAVPHGE